jgi:trans-aconitate 2-methyltransferase
MAAAQPQQPADPWSPAQYNRFKAERAQPFYDLAALLKPLVNKRVVDLGCGTGELTRELHLKLAARETLGLDNSTAMLAASKDFPAPGLRFEAGDIGKFEARGAWDLIFSNAAIQWLDSHEGLMRRFFDALAPGGQLALQFPANLDHPSHTLAAEVAQAEPYRTWLGGWSRRSPIFSPERYAEELFAAGFAEQHVRLQVYGHRLASADEVVEWVSGTLLTPFKQKLSAEQFTQFVADYRARLNAQLGPARPYFYSFKRILLWAQKA